MDDNEFPGRPDGNGSGARPSWAERVNLPDHLRPPLPRRELSDEASEADDDHFALPLVQSDVDEPKSAPVDGILPESEDGETEPTEGAAEPDAPRTTPADTVAAPEPGAEIDLDDTALYLNRELTWLNFNYRVLAEAEDERTPLLERLKFCLLYTSPSPRDHG